MLVYHISVMWSYLTRKRQGPRWPSGQSVGLLIQCAFTSGWGSIPYHGGVLTQHLDIYVGRLRCIQIVQYRMSLEMCMDCPSAAEPSQAAVSR